MIPENDKDPCLVLYRPISLFPILPNVFERLLQQKIVNESEPFQTISLVFEESILQWQCMIKFLPKSDLLYPINFIKFWDFFLTILDLWSKWTVKHSIRAGYIPQGVGQFFYNRFASDFPTIFSTQTAIFADDFPILSCVNNPNTDIAISLNFNWKLD